MYYITSAPTYTRHWTTRRETENSLPLNIHDDGEAFVMTALVPGLKDEDLNIQILDDAISIEGQYAQHEGEYLLSELPAGSFRRILRLPSALDAENAEAHIENGVLTLRVPKAESARPRIIKVASR